MWVPHLPLFLVLLGASAYAVWCSRLEKTTELPSLRLHNADDCESALRQGSIAACLKIHKGCCYPLNGFGGDPGLQSPTVVFCTQLLSGSLGPACWGLSQSRDRGRGGQTQHVVSGRSSKGSTRSDGLRPLQKSSSTVLCDLL